MSFAFLSSLFLSILLTAGGFLNLTPPLTSTLHSLFNPLLSPLTYFRGQNKQVINFIIQIPEISKQNLMLAKDNNLLRIRIKELTSAIKDQTFVDTLSKHTWQIQPIRLVGLGSSALFTSRDFTAIRPGQPVLSDNSLLGVVASVEAPIIKVTALNHPDLRIAVQLETGVKGDYVYKNNHPYVINLPTTVAFNAKTIVLTLPTELIPENLIVGQIDKITSNPANPTQEATIALDQEINSATNFFIITKP